MTLIGILYNKIENHFQLLVFFPRPLPVKKASDSYIKDKKQEPNSSTQVSIKAVILKENFPQKLDC